MPGFSFPAVLFDGPVPQHRDDCGACRNGALARSQELPLEVWRELARGRGIPLKVLLELQRKLQSRRGETWQGQVRRSAIARVVFGLQAHEPLEESHLTAVRRAMSKLEQRGLLARRGRIVAVHQWTPVAVCPQWLASPSVSGGLGGPALLALVFAVSRAFLMKVRCPRCGSLFEEAAGPSLPWLERADLGRAGWSANTSSAAWNELRRAACCVALDDGERQWIVVRKPPSAGAPP